MEFQFSFEKLEVWNDARDLVKKIYLLTQSFSHQEQYGLTQQIQRAVVSVVSNIAEGMGRLSLKEQSHFCEIAYGSLMEVYTQLLLAYDLQYIEETKKDEIIPVIKMIAFKLNGLHKSINQRIIEKNQQIKHFQQVNQKR